MGPVARLLPDGRLHLQHGPSDLIVLAEGEHQRAFDAAIARFETIIAEVVDELPQLRAPLRPGTLRPNGAVAQRMHDAVLPFAEVELVTPMVAVAGAIADEVLAAMVAAADLCRASVGNGGDIAFHLTPKQKFRTAIKGHDGANLGRIEIHAADSVHGIATSGRHGRSLSRGIADSVTVLARSAADADVAATLVANAVDLPDHPAITRRPAQDVIDDSDLGDLSVVVGCGALSGKDAETALDAGRARAVQFQSRGLIAGASLFLQGYAATTVDRLISPHQEILCA